MLTIEDIRNPIRQSGFDHVTVPGPRSNWKGYRTQVYQSQVGTHVPLKWSNGIVFSGLARATPEEAAQDWCDFVNSRGRVPATPGLKRAGHLYEAPSPDYDPEEEAALGYLRDKRAQRIEGKQGYVYAITDGEYVKIGYSTNPSKRVAELQTGNARLLACIGTMEGTEDDEKLLHAKYAHLNVLQEWFEIDPELLAEFNNEPAAESGGQPKEATTAP
jgi:hypothetical protein